MLAKMMTVKQRLWLGHVKAADQSDDSTADYVQDHGLRLKTLYQCKSKLIRLGLYWPDGQATQSDFVTLGSARASSTLQVCTIITELPKAMTVQQIEVLLPFKTDIQLDEVA